MLAGGWPAIRTVALLSLREALRRRVFLVVVILTIAFLALFGLGSSQLFDEINNAEVDFDTGVRTEIIAAATIFGLAMFATLFLGTILAVFLTLGAVRGDAERGLLQPVIVRPVGRDTFLLARFLAAATVCGVYVTFVYLGTLALVRLTGDWSPDRVLLPLVGLVAAVTLMCALSLLGSVLLSSTANGIAVFMAFGAGLVAGLLGQIGDALNSDTLENVAEWATWILPFEGLYQAGLSALTEDTGGLEQVAISLGPFGGANPAGATIWPYSVVYLVVVGALALLAFRARDL